MTDFGLDDDIVDETQLIEALRWHGIIPNSWEETKEEENEAQHTTIT